MRPNDVQLQPEPSLHEQSSGPFTMDHYRVQGVKNDPYLSFSGISLHSETCAAGGHLNHGALLASGSLLLLLGPFCSFVSFGADFHSRLCSTIFPFTSVKDSTLKKSEL